VRWRQYLCRAGSAHNSVEAASIATAMSIGPSWSAKVDYGPSPIPASTRRLRRFWPFAGLQRTLGVRALRTFAPDVYTGQIVGSQRTPRQSKVLYLQTLNEPTVTRSQRDVVLGIC
jgi:hypothetical protein